MIKAYIDRIEEDKAVMLLGDDYDKKLNFPVKFLPADIGEGDYVTIEIRRDEKAEDEAAEDLLDLWQSTKG